MHWRFVRALGALVGAAATALAVVVVGHGNESKAAGPATTAYGQLPISFERNAGQTDSRVDYLARGRDYGMWLMSGKTVVALGNDVFRTRLLGAASDAAASGVAKLPGKVNYLIGKDGGAWRTGIATYAKVRYDDVYPGIDQIFYGTGDGKLEYDFVVAPGADPQRIALAFDGVKGLSLDRHGDLIVDLPGGPVVQEKPVVYQVVDGARRAVDGRYVLHGGARVAFRLGAYERSAPLVIDPVLVYSTYFGGSAGELGNGVAIDGAGNAYITGTTSSVDLPTLNPFQRFKKGFQDAYVTKLNADGSAIVYSTYLGGGSGPSGEIAHGIAVDSGGSAYVTGITGSSDFPTTPGSLQPSYQGQEDGFVTKLSADGSALEYSTYLGGSQGLDIGRDLVVDSAGNAYVTGDTDATDFPTTPGSFQPACANFLGCSDAFLAKLDSTGSTLVWSTFLGAAGNESGNDVALYNDSEPFLVGTTSSTSFPTTPGAFQRTCVGCEFRRSDAFVTRFSATGSSLVFSTYLGGSIDDFGRGIAVDGSGDAVVTGEAESSSGSSKPFPTTPGAYDTTSNGTPDAFVSKVSSNGKVLIYSTYLGGAVADEGSAVKLDEAGNAHVIGETRSRDFPTKDPIQPVCGCFQGGGTDAFVTELNAAGSALVFSTYLGGLSSDSGDDIVLDGAGNDYAVGTTYAMDFPTTPGAFKRTNNGSADAFVTKIGLAQSEAPAISSFAPANGPTGTQVTIDGSGFTNVLSVKFGARTATFDVVSPNRILAVVPDGAKTGTITVTTAFGTATSADPFVVSLSITNLSPSKGRPGTVVTISGVGFADATHVEFNGVPAQFTIVSPKKIRATVPAAKTGPVTVTSPEGTVRSEKNFKVS